MVFAAATGVVCAQPKGGKGGGNQAQAIKEVKPGLYLITGAGGNSSVRVTSEGIILVDGKLPAEGNYDKFVGKVQERYGDKKDELMKWADQSQQLFQPEPRRKRRAATVPCKSVNAEIRKENSGHSGGYVPRLTVQYI